MGRLMTAFLEDMLSPDEDKGLDQLVAELLADPKGRVLLVATFGCAIRTQERADRAGPDMLLTARMLGGLLKKLRPDA